MNETRTCQNCKNQFTVSDADLTFYEKLKVPRPTFCPDCRLQRRMTFRNEFTFYKRPCDLCKKEVIATYPAQTPFPVYCHDCWWSDSWNPSSYGQEVDFTRPFFAQFKSLIETVPRIATFRHSNCINCDYVNYAYNSKDGYLMTGFIDSENCAYGNIVWHSKDSLDSFYLINSELCYEAINCHQCYRSEFVQDCVACNNSLFLYNCRNCSDCIGCVNLIGKQYHIFNVPYTKEAYQKFREQYMPLTMRKIQELETKFEDLKHRSIHKFADITSSQNTIGDHVRSGKNAHHAFYSYEAEDSKFLVVTGEIEDVYDFNNGTKLRLSYECVSTPESYNCYFSSMFTTSFELRYCDMCHSSKNCFGCVGLKNGEYCILNKRYGKEEYEELVPRIIAHMNAVPYVDKGGREYRYGEFFPIELSPYSYNDSQANDYFPLSKEKIVRRGYPYHEPEVRSYKTTVQAADLPGRISDVSDNVLKEIIECSTCQYAYRVVPQELSFYRNSGLPLPQSCPTCRRKARIARRNPLALWHRQCTCEGMQSEKTKLNIAYQNTIDHSHKANHCPNEFETPYSSDRKEIVYCEQCYNAEVV